MVAISFTWSGNQSGRRSPTQSTRRRNQRGCFDRNLLPSPQDYYAVEGIELRGRGTWRDAVCVFHDDKRPSLRVQFETGAFRCMACGAHGSDVLAFHMLRHGLKFVDAVTALGAWKDKK